MPGSEIGCIVFITGVTTLLFCVFGDRTAFIRLLFGSIGAKGITSRWTIGVSKPSVSANETSVFSFFIDSILLYLFRGGSWSLGSQLE